MLSFLVVSDKLTKCFTSLYVIQGWVLGMCNPIQNFQYRKVPFTYQSAFRRRGMQVLET